MIDDFTELLETAVQGDLLVFLEEEPGIGKPGPDDLFVAPGHHGRIPGRGVVDGDEMRQQPARGVHHGKVLLMGHHGGGQNLPGELEVVGIENAADRRRIFDEKGDGFQEIVGDERLAVHGGGDPLRLFPNDFFPFFRIDDHPGFPGLVQIISKVRDGKGTGAHEAVSPRGVAGLNVFDPDGDNLATVKGQEPMNRPGETELQIGPAHGLFEGDGHDEFGEQAGQHGGDIAAGDPFPGAEVLALIRGDDFDFSQVDALSPGETHRRLGRISSLVEGGLAGRADLFDYLIFLSNRHIGDMEQEAPRRRHGGDRSEFNPFPVQCLADQLVHVGHGPGQKGGRNLFRADFKQQFFSHSLILL